jgi:hypothetical protein
MKLLGHSVAAVLGLLGALTPTPGNFNPIVSGYFADQTVEKCGDLYYLRTSADGEHCTTYPARGHGRLARFLADSAQMTRR